MTQILHMISNDQDRIQIDGLSQTMAHWHNMDDNLVPVFVALIYER